MKKISKQMQIQEYRLKQRKIPKKMMQEVMDDLDHALNAARELIEPDITHNHAFIYDKIRSRLNELMWEYLPEDVL